MIELPFDPSYQANEWGIVEAWREVYSNALDGALRYRSQGLGALSVEYAPGSLAVRVRNEGVKLALSDLLIGRSASRSIEDAIGTFGEGLPMAMLSVARQRSFHMVITNDDERWEPELGHSDQYGTTVLRVKTRKLRKARGHLEVELGGVTPELWGEFQRMFLKLDPEYDDTQVARSVDGRNAVLLQPSMVGRIYVKGVYVCTRPNMKYGYNLDMALNRDRKMLDEWSLKYTLATLVSECASAHPEKFGGFISAVLDGGEPFEASHMGSYSSDQYVEKLADQFLERHGADAFPVASMAEAQKLSFYGVRGVTVSPNVLGVLQRRFGTPEDRMVELSHEVVKTHSWCDLSPDEQRVMTKCAELMDACKVFPANVMERLRVVDFRSDALVGTYGDNGNVSVRRAALSSEESLLRVWVHEEAHRFGADGTAEHENGISTAFAAMVQYLL